MKQPLGSGDGESLQVFLLVIVIVEVDDRVRAPEVKPSSRQDACSRR
ncbi:hypothetical protein LINPERPRIM_LOCUS27244 [Linum perenne]